LEKNAQHIEYDFRGTKNKIVMAARILHLSILHLSIQWMRTSDEK